MKHRIAFLVAACILFIWVFASARSLDWAGLYPEEQLQFGIYLIIANLFVWLVLEVAARFLDARTMHCARCGYDLAGTKCPECAKPIASRSDA